MAYGRIMKIINNFLYISSRYLWLPRKAWFSVPKFYRFIGFAARTAPTSQVQQIMHYKIGKPTQPFEMPHKLTKQEIEERVLKVVKMFHRLQMVNDTNFTLDSHFVNDLGLDSLDYVELMLAVEEEFDIEIPDDEIEKLMTGVKLTNYVCKVKGVEN
ncbi:Acyl carrier protein, mitochondrial [Trichinella britovi]|uniref:Acyl carrier protein n=2 Tax=Trichinella TaxID=6333 RepID=A0A0V1DD21_TRIBR|nr:Acyl carrier protein, mitochondrial [Trichinella murrelli]KRX82591.1 Acyl carrier protein, mitochondrial [Trichinella sp. T6]KRY59431.1 Acyl carrier protein, mitochondrial [Trichinella britovi]KRZ97441.1 Acyl carrier protein, mitochondrial [Trichinella sp. T8]